MRTNHKGTWTWKYEVGRNERIGSSVVFSPLMRDGKVTGYYSYAEAKDKAEAAGSGYYLKRRRVQR